MRRTSLISRTDDVFRWHATDSEMDGLRTNAYNKALSIQDQLFHSALYDWYLSRGMTDQLLEVGRNRRRLGLWALLMRVDACFGRRRRERHT